MHQRMCQGTNYSWITKERYMILSCRPHIQNMTRGVYLPNILLFMYVLYVSIGGMWKACLDRVKKMAKKYDANPNPRIFNKKSDERSKPAFEGFS